ncbi:MAG: adenylate/guanylate cyclase domain-containing protein [Thermodesulfobacteriota bacterium]
MIWRIRNSIVSKMTLLVMGGASLVFALVVTYSYLYSREIILNEAEQNARNLALSVAGRIEQEFRAVGKIPEGLARFLESQPCERERNLLALLRGVVSDNREIFGAAAAFEPGAFVKELRAYAPYFFKTDVGIQYVQIASPNYDYFQQDYYHITKLLNKPLWTEPYFDEGGGNILMVTYSVPLHWPSEQGKQGSFRGIITADVSLEWLAALVNSVRVEKSGYCFIISDTGKFVTYPRREYLMAESIFSIAEEQHSPRLRDMGRAMINSISGFEDIGSDLTSTEAFLAFAQIPSPGWSLAAVHPKEELFAEVTALHQRTVLLAAVGVGLLFAVSLWVARSLTRPLLRMADATRKVAKGDLDIDLTAIHTTDEVGQLARAFGHMVEGLKQRDFIRSTFGRYLTKEVVTRLIESQDGLKLGGEAREITLMMSDLRGFTALTSHMAPQDVISFLNRYLGRMVEILIEHRGIIDEIIGDGILSFFGAPEPLEDHPARAVACALTMQAAMAQINALNEADGLAHLEMGIAVHTGTVVVGNIGSEKRSKYGAVGSEVNFTGRMESYAVGGQVLISEATYGRIRDLVEVKHVMQAKMKGIPGKVMLYDVKGIKGRYQVTLPEKNETPRPWPERLKVLLWRLREKVVQETALQAWITHTSDTSAIILLGSRLEQWEDIRLVLHTSETDHVEGEVYGKVVSVSEKDHQYEALVRLTSMSPHVHKFFRQRASVA